MKRKGLSGYKPPAYPARGEVGESALVRWMPRRWRSNGKVAAGMAILFAAGPGVPAAFADATPPPVGDSVNGKAKPVVSDKGNLPRIFEHGEGRGAFGCVAVAPPAFLTEADARQVILEEFAKVGVKFELDKKTVPGLRKVEVEVTYKEVKNPKGGSPYEKVRHEKDAGPLVLDGYDVHHNLGFEYISEEDYFKLGGERDGSTVQSYDFKPLATRLSAAAQRDGSVRLGVFYDPMASVDWHETSDTEYHDPPNEKGRAQLRAQVRDFITWLKSEKIL
jgi:hypothetical protein